MRSRRDAQKKIFVKFDEYICRHLRCLLFPRKMKKNYEGNMNGNKSSHIPLNEHIQSVQDILCHTCHFSLDLHS